MATSINFSQVIPASSFLIESSPTPIYQRITQSYQQSLERKGHRVIYFNPSQFGNFNESLRYFINVVQSGDIDYLVIFSNSATSKSYVEELDCFVFELFSNPVIFIHYDDLWSELGSTHLLEAWRRVQGRSIHFCLEYTNFLDLRDMGFKRVHLISHGSEFTRIDPPSEYAYEVSFVGHVLPNFSSAFESLQSLPFSHSIAADFWSRLVSLDKKIDPSAVIYAGQQGNTIKDVEFVKRKSVYRNLIGLLSPYLRGELLSHLDPQFSLAIFGGDPGYLNSLASDRRIESQVITYYPPTSSYTETQNLYADSKINLNITSPQFDDAVVNRVIDVAAVGGFILTDWKPDLVKLTAVSEQISYRTIEELNSKIHYYITHNDERLEVARQLHQDVAEKCSYEQVIRFCLSRLNFVDDQLYSQSEVMQVDLGCGSHKPDGFIGVDVSSRPGVDIVADLNRRFPFPDNSVDFLRAFDVIEHLSDRIHTMNEIWRICKPDAQVDIRVPSTDGRGAFQDPTHVSFWNINSFKYYSIEFPEYLDLCRSYGFQGAFSIISLTDEETSPDRVIHVRAILRANKFDISPLHDLHKNLKLREINLIITPDWCQSDDSLYPPIIDVIRTLSQHPNRQQITLLVDKGNFPNNSETSPEQIFYELVFNLFLTEDIDVEDEDISISFIEDLAANKSTGLFQEITCRVLLPQENSRSLKTLENVDFPVCDLATLSI